MKELILSYGEFYHVTSRTLWDECISTTGLDPAKGAECCAGRCEPATFLCTREKLDKSISMIGSKYDDQEELVIVRILASDLIGKHLIGDITYQRGIQDLETSLNETGNMGCLDLIPTDEFDDMQIIKNLNKML